MISNIREMHMLRGWKQTSTSNKLMVWTSILVAFGTLFYGGAAVFQYCLMKSTADSADVQTKKLINEAGRMATAMETSNVQAQKALEASIKQAQKALDISVGNAKLDQRAWVGPIEATEPLFSDGSDKVYVKEGMKTTLGVVVINTGKTPALKHRHKIGMHIIKAETALVPDYPTTKTPSSITVIQPGGRVIEEVTSNTVMTKELLDKLSSGDYILYLHGIINYEDIFRVPHETTFCMYLKPNLKTLSACETYNETK
jgi:hypothetical protein